MIENQKKETLHVFFTEFFKAMSNLQCINKELVEKQGVSYVCWQIIAVIWTYNDNKPMTISNIANALAISRQAVQKQVKILIKESILESTINICDKRAPCYGLTTKGMSLTECMQKNVYDEWMDEAFKNVTTEQIKSASLLLKHLTSL